MRVADGLVVTLEYTVRVASGAVLDSTGQCGPVSILTGAGQLFPALEDRLGSLAAGETKTFRIPPEEAYGPRDPALVRPIPRDQLPADLEVGGEYRLKAQPGRALRFRVVEIGPEMVQADFNAPYAGEELVATVTIIDVRPPTPEEARRGRT
jgi:FKBP-type peptidyl-prolyl cis-trans isomerase 2